MDPAAVACPWSGGFGGRVPGINHPHHHAADDERSTHDGKAFQVLSDDLGQKKGRDRRHY
jgi:hypothetical protein